MICNIKVGYSRQEKMCIAFDSCLGQVHRRFISTLYRIPEALCHRKKSTPLFLTRVYRRLIGNVVTVIDEEGNLVSFMKSAIGTVGSITVRPESLMPSGVSPSGKNKITAGLKGNDCLYLQKKKRQEAIAAWRNGCGAGSMF